MKVNITPNVLQGFKVIVRSLAPTNGGASGEVNTGDNAGTEGLGIYDGKIGAVLQFRNVKAGSGRLAIQFNVGTKTLEFDLGTVNIADVQGLQNALDGKQPSGNYAASVHSHAIGDITNLTATLAGKMDASVYDPNGNGTVNDSERLAGEVAANYALKSYVDNAINNLVNGSPALLDTLNELSNALGNDPNFATTITNALAGKEPSITAGTATQYWAGNKTWQVLNLDAVAETANRKHVTQAEKDSWNAKASDGDKGDVVISASGATYEVHSIAKALELKGALVPAALTANANDYNPSGLSDAANLKLSSTANIDVTGIAGGAEGRVLLIKNVGNFLITLKDENAGSAASNRFSTPGDVELPPGKMVLAVYGSLQNRWDVIGYHKADGIFGTGSDGDVTISSGTTTLVRDMYYRNLTISGTGKLRTAGFKVFVENILDLSNAPTGAIDNIATNGSNATSNTGAAAPSADATGSLGRGQQGAAGGNGGTAAGSQAAAATPTAGIVLGGQAGSGGAGGLGSGGAGGAQRTSSAPTNTFLMRRLTEDFIRGITLLIGGGPGVGGSGGGGDGTAAGGGGSGGNGGGIIVIMAKYINRGSNANANIVQVPGGNGGNGFSQTAGNRGGGGGAGGGGGGWIFIAYNFLLGNTITNALSSQGGAGGNGGNGFGTGVGGNGGNGGFGGRITLFDIENESTTESVGVAGNNGNAAAGVSGGTGGAGSNLQVNL
ncbi:MAG: hypothetical protein ACK5QX_00710 [bacterium]